MAMTVWRTGAWRLQVVKQKVARPAQEHGGESTHVAVDRRQQRVLETAVGIQLWRALPLCL